MTDLKLFRLSAGKADALDSSSAKLEKDLQKLLEANMGTIFGVHFLQSEYSTGKVHGGRIDSLGLDENGLPVIFEYKRHQNENVINQGLYYLDWLMDHRGEFQLLVQQRLGAERASAIDWSGPRLVCVANTFTKFDEHAVKQIDRNIQLVRYQYYGEDLFAVELLTTTEKSTVAPTASLVAVVPGLTPSSPGAPAGGTAEKSVMDKLSEAGPRLRELFERVNEFAQGLGEDVTRKVNKNYVAFRRLKNFACLEIHPQANNLLVYLKLDPADYPEEQGFRRDMSTLGHFGTGDVELRFATDARWDEITAMIQQAYEEN